MEKVDPHRRMLYARWARNRATLATEWQDYAVFEAWAMGQWLDAGLHNRLAQKQDRSVRP